MVLLRYEMTQTIVFWTVGFNLISVKDANVSHVQTVVTAVFSHDAPTITEQMKSEIEEKYTLNKCSNTSSISFGYKKDIKHY